MERSGTIMPDARKPMGLALLASIVLFLTAVPAEAAGDRALGAHLAAECTGCHQLSRRSTGGIPPIAGWPAPQFVAALEAYRSKERGDPAMQAVAARLSRDEIAALAAYFGALPPKP